MLIQLCHLIYLLNRNLIFGPVYSFVRVAIYIFQRWILRVQEVLFFLNSQIMNKYGQDFADILSVRYIIFDVTQNNRNSFYVTTLLEKDKLCNHNELFNL